MNTALSTAPAIIGGEKLNTSFLNGPDRSGMFAACAFSAIDDTEMPTAIPPSASHVVTQAQGNVWRAATSAAAIAVTPMTTSPHPDTAVKVAARSIMPRM